VVVVQARLGEENRGEESQRKANRWQKTNAGLPLASEAHFVGWSTSRQMCTTGGGGKAVPSCRDGKLAAIFTVFQYWDDIPHQHVT
jgi:hypothetical protein